MTCSDILQIVSEVKSDLWFEISDLNYPDIHVHVTLLIIVFISPRPLRPPNSLGGQIWPQIWNQWPKEPMWPKFQGTFVSHFRNFSRVKSVCSWPALALQVISSTSSVSNECAVRTPLFFFSFQFSENDETEIIPEIESCRSEYMTIFVGCTYAYKGVLMVRHISTVQISGVILPRLLHSNSIS